MDPSMQDSILAAAKGPTDKTLRVVRNKLYPMQAWYCLGLFIFIVGVFQWASYFHSKFARKHRNLENADPELASANHPRRFSLRRLPVALTNMYRVVAFRWTLEFGKSYTLNLAEVFVTMAYIIFLYVWAFVDTTDLEGHKLDLTYWCNRAGTLAASQFPLITALGTKNNLVSLVTGVSYDKLNYVHRMMARVVTVLLWVHAGSEVIYEVPFQPYLQYAWLRCGIVAIVAITLLCFVSLRPIRANAYELFFYVHFAMVLTFLICAYFHAQYDMMTYWIYPCFAIWGLDRFIRVCRLVVFNHSYFGFRSGSTLDATTELLSDDFVRLRFHRPSHFRWTPGQTAYLIMPHVSRLPFEAHPFTIASFDSNLFDSIEEQKPSGEKSTSTSLAEHALGSSTPFWKEVVFFINIREGFTARLKETALKGGKVKVFVDGPYGPSPDLSSYDTSILIAGGSGVSYTLPTLLDIIERARNGKSDCRRVVFIWSIRDANHIHWIDETLIRALQLAPPHLTVSIRIHVTGAPATIEPLAREYGDDDAASIQDDSRSEIVELESGKAMEKSKDSLLAIDAVKVENGRPNLPVMLREEVDMATGRMSVSVCGSQAVARSVRRALRFPVSSPSNVLNGGPSVTLHVESFGYA
ncbi:ferric reductase NAD binding domain-containing protein [Hygrophoropsis aurantiaca]|uniref:Ferric reductase NAD binding domain-containing protein n=1 Tax=Hygrophoropsis aurantiaca TaxID=72124 RepID=A0ACB8AI81_9AGAM|nr:ferric reductase NAD binding domain-containing protein [Hygrophoropsis aurantiaca]